MHRNVEKTIFRMISYFFFGLLCFLLYHVIRIQTPKGAILQHTLTTTITVILDFERWWWCDVFWLQRWRLTVMMGRRMAWFPTKVCSHSYCFGPWSFSVHLVRLFIPLITVSSSSWIRLFVPPFSVSSVNKTIWYIKGVVLFTCRVRRP